MVRLGHVLALIGAVLMVLAGHHSPEESPWPLIMALGFISLFVGSSAVLLYGDTAP